MNNLAAEELKRVFGLATDAELGGAAIYFTEGPGVDHPKRNAILRIIARAGETVATEAAHE